ncbi:MAG: lipopolysaccharide biosynthesis protein [Pseudolabrys sp.]|nr:lipopolysaccharide biosynthesis protein [Pseudolabrys sp.]
MFGRKSDSQPAHAKPPKKAKVKASRPAPPPAVPYGGEPDIGGLGRALWRSKTRIIGLTVIAAAFATVAVNGMTPRYRSEARILLESKENVFLRAEADKQSERAAIDPEAVTSQIQVVLSRDLAREVIRKEKLGDLPEFDPARSGVGIGKTLLGLFGLARDPNSMSPEERTLEAFYERLNVFAIERSRVIAIDFTSSDPELAARVANAIAETYLTVQQSSKQEQTRAASAWLASEIATMRDKVADAEAKVEEYRSKANLYSGSNNMSLPNQQLTEINSQISAARAQKADLEARARQLRDLLRSGKSIDSSDIANSESMRRLNEQRVALRAQLAEQSSTLLERHPRIKELQAQIGEVERQIRTEGERLARQIDSDAAVAGNRLETLTASIDQVKKLASQTNEQDVQVRALEREVKAQRELLESYLAKYREASARENINAAPPEARIISRASPAIKPDSPKKVPIILIAAFAAFALSSGFVLTGELLAPASAGYTYPAAVYGSPEMPAARMVLTAPPVPPAPPPVMPSPVARVLNPAPAPAALKIEQVAAQLRALGEGGRRVAVAGAQRNAGTTYAAIALARALSRDANVVLVDLAFNAPNLSVISTDPHTPGIAELVRGEISFGDMISRDQFSNVHIVSTGNVGADANAIAASPALDTAIEALAMSYNYIVLDIGAVPEVAVERYAALASRAVIVGANDAATRAAQQRLAMAGFADVTMVLGAAQAAAA